MNKKNKNWIYLLAIIGVVLIFNNSCKKEDNNNAFTVTDIDSNVYHTVTIGTQVWMVENLKTTKFNDGTVIANVTDDSEWDTLTTPAYCWYNDSAIIYKATYGAIYNWYTVNTGKLAPKGWHVPTHAEWETLITYLGGDKIGGYKMKEAGSMHWKTPNTNSNNSSGFTALPGGCRGYKGMFIYIGNLGYWWSSSLSTDSVVAWSISIGYGSNAIICDEQISFSEGMSVRCIKD